MRKLVECVNCGRMRPHAAHGFCASCNAALWKINNREKVRASGRETARRARAAKSPEDRRQLDKAAYRRNAERRKEQARQQTARLSWAARRVLKSRSDRSQLSVAQLEQMQAATPCCACCATPLSYDYYRRGVGMPMHVATLDKIVPAFGYVPGNIAIICYRCNRLKDQMTLEEARMVVAYIARHTSSTPR